LGVGLFIIPGTEEIVTKNLYYEPRATVHYNVQFKVGGLVNRVIGQDLFEVSSQEIAWVWIVEEKRNATPEEIKQLCKPVHER
jgi:hypothetical protein